MRVRVDKRRGAAGPRAAGSRYTGSRAVETVAGGRGRQRLAIAFALSVAAVLMVAAPAAYAGISDPTATPSWSALIRGPGASYDAAKGVAMGSGGAAYVCGIRDSAAGDREVTLAKWVNGTLAWVPKAYNGAGAVDDDASGIALGPNAAVYTVGASGTDTWTALDILLVKWSGKTGKVLWAKRYRGPAGKRDAGFDIGVDKLGNVTVAGTSDGADGYADWLVRSWTASGKVRWTWRSDWSDDAHDAPHDLLVAADGSVYVTGFVDASGPGRIATIRLSPAGKRLWSRLWPGPDGISGGSDALAARPGGGVYVCGYTTTTANKQDGFVASYSPRGARTVFALDDGAGGATNQGFKDLAVTATGHIVAAGYDDAGGVLQPHHAVYTPDGSMVDDGLVPSTQRDWYTAVAADAFGGYYMAGTRSLGADDRRILTVRASTLGIGGAWTSLYTPAASADQDVAAIGVRGTSVVVAGHVGQGLPNGFDQVVLGFVY